MIQRLTSKAYLERSAMELFSRTDVERVTVKDICNNCGLSTRTFYKYYKDKYDIINTCFTSELETFYSRSSDEIRIQPFLKFTAEIVNNHRAFFKNVFRYTGQNNIRSYLVEPLSDCYFRIIGDYCNAEITDEIEDAVIFFIQGQLAHVEEALTRTNIPDSDDTVSFFENAIPAKLVEFL